MATALISKKRIAKAFKTLLKERSFDKISVVDIMDLADIRRQTFYKHFLDKYELLDWIFETELKEQVTDNLTYISGFQLLQELLLYLDANQSFYRQAFAIKGQNDFSSFFLGYCLQLLEKICHEETAKQGLVLEKAYLDFLSNYHATALLGLIKTYLKQDKSSISDLYANLCHLLRSSLITSKGDRHDQHHQ